MTAKRKSSSIPLVRLWLAVLCGYLALGVTLQTLPIYMIQHFHAGSFLVGITIGIASLAAALVRPIAGCAADNNLARLVVLLGGIFSILGGLGHWFAPNIIILLISRLFLGAGEGALFTGAVSLVVYHCLPKKRGNYAGWFGLSMWGGLCAGPILANVFTTIFGNNVSIWLLVTLLPIISLALLLTTSIPRDVIPSQHSQRLTLFPHEATWPGIAFLFASYGYGSINSMLILYLEHSHLRGKSIALPIFAACFLIIRIIGSPLVNFFGARLVLLEFIFIEIIGLLMISWISSSSIILLGTGLTGVGLALLYPAFVAVIAQQVPPTQQGAAIGLMTSFWDLGLVISGSIGGLIASLFGFGNVFLIAAIFASLSLIITFGPINYRRNLLTNKI